MKKNIIQILKSGNQELFYSSFFAWLLSPDGEHGLENKLLSWFLDKIQLNDEIVSIDTEQRIDGGRADILLKLKSGVCIAIENKTKSIGRTEQLLNYENESLIVIPVGLLKENFPSEQREKVITYFEICNQVKKIELNNTKLSPLVDNFVQYVDSMLAPFVLFDQYCKEEIGLEEVQKRISEIEIIDVNDNDRRFFQAIYFDRLLSYMYSFAPSLIFGTENYYNEKKGQEKPPATKWIIQKNLQGPAFMEAIFYTPKDIPGIIKLNEKWLAVFDSAVTQDMSPRLEMWKGPYDIADNDSAGVFQIGCWDEFLHNHFSLSGAFNKRGSRNFHYRTLTTSDFPYRKMTEILQEEMSKIWDWQ